MDALWVDDPPMGAEKELEDLLANAFTEEEVAAIGAEWGTRHFRSR
jgi:predicted glycosyltransferase